MRACPSKWGKVSSSRRCSVEGNTSAARQRPWSDVLSRAQHLLDALAPASCASCVRAQTLHGQSALRAMLLTVPGLLCPHIVEGEPLAGL